jgi:hypothetical protein
MASRRQLILEALSARVAEITISHEFDTDAGLALYLGELVELGPDDPETAIAIVVGVEEPRYQGENLYIALPITIHALARPDLDQPWIAVEQVISDIKRAVELPDRTLGGLVKRQIERGSVVTIERAAGSTVVGMSITYTCPYLEGWGAP